MFVPSSVFRCRLACLWVLAGLVLAGCGEDSIVASADTAADGTEADQTDQELALLVSV